MLCNTVAHGAQAIDIPRMHCVCLVTMYHDGSNSYTVVGDKIYTTNGTSNPLGDGYYRQPFRSKSNQSIRINSDEGDDGEVMEVSNC